MALRIFRLLDCDDARCYGAKLVPMEAWVVRRLDNVSELSTPHNHEPVLFRARKLRLSLSVQPGKSSPNRVLQHLATQHCDCQ